MVKTILVVDDDLAIQIAMRMVLESEGHEVLLASHGQQALDIILVEKRNLDLILLDLHMPGMSGLEVRRQVMSSALYKNKKIPIVISTASDLRQDGLDPSQFDGVLIKPFELMQLIRVCAPFL